MKSMMHGFRGNAACSHSNTPAQAVFSAPHPVCNRPCCSTAKHARPQPADAACVQLVQTQFPLPRTSRRASTAVCCSPAQGVSSTSTSQQGEGEQVHQGVPAHTTAASQEMQDVAQEPASAYCVVNTYHLVEVATPRALVEEHRRYINDNSLDVKGRIYISGQGINAQFGGVRDHALQYVQWLKEQELWKDLRYSVWPAEDHMFPKLRLKYKPNLISLAGGLADLPITKPEARATPIPPKQWKEMTAQLAHQNKAVLLDVRNDYEWDAGHFRGAARPAEEEFNDTPVGEGEEGLPAPLRGADPETPVMMMCTGGIRCDIYSTLLRAKGFKNLYTLEGGIQNYLRQEGSEHWDGSLFVFDGRMAVSPEEATSARPATPEHGVRVQGPRPAAVPCQVCGQADGELPHVNCANIDCNELFIACSDCKQRLNGCCCESCMNAPRMLRPAKVAGGNYGTWNRYANSTAESFLSPKAREGRVARRARRRANVKQKHQKIVEQRAARKTMMREAMAKLMTAQELPARPQTEQQSKEHDGSGREAVPSQ